MSSEQRPLSPHLQVYRPQLTSVLSILHRLTGIALALGVVALVWWLIAVATGPDYYATVQAIIGSFIGRLALFGWTFALFYHLLNGIRHLGWDAGWGFEMPSATTTGWLVVIGSTVLSIVAWLGGYAAAGGL